MSSVEYDTEYDENSSFQICGTIENDNEGCNINTNFDYVCDRDFPPLEYFRLPNSCKSDWNGVKYYLKNQKFTVQKSTLHIQLENGSFKYTSVNYINKH